MTRITAMGFEGQVFYGAAGSTATTQIENSRDVKVSLEPQMGDTTVRGDGTKPPVESEAVTSLKWSMTMQMINKSDDTILAALLAAAAVGDPVAIRMKDRTTGKGYDGDCNVKYEHGMPLKGEQTFDFSFTPNDDQRTPDPLC